MMRAEFPVKKRGPNRPNASICISVLSSTGSEFPIPADAQRLRLQSQSAPPRMCASATPQEVEPFPPGRFKINIDNQDATSWLLTHRKTPTGRSAPTMKQAKSS